MPASRSVRTVLLVAHGVVIVLVALVGFMVVRWLTPPLFGQRLGLGRGWASANSARGSGAGNGRTELETSELSDSLDRAVTIAAGAAALTGALVAATVAWWITRLLMSRIATVRDATRRLADGDLEARVMIWPETELAELALAINDLGESLASTDRARARLVSDLAHELRNPLMTIQGSMEGLIDGIVPPTPETFSSVAEEADRLRRLTDDLSMLAKGREGSLQMCPRSIDLAHLSEEVVSRFQSHFELEGVGLRFIGDRPTPVFADPDRMAQVLVNILGNALTHTARGGTVTVGVEPVPPDPGRERELGGRLWIEDTGSGIPTDELGTVFDRYTRLDHQRPGTGIGLNIARTIVTALGGRITAHSDGLGTGARFTIELPKSESSPGAA